MENAPAQSKIARLESVVFATPCPKMPVLSRIDELSAESEQEDPQAWKFSCSDICFLLSNSKVYQE